MGIDQRGRTTPDSLALEWAEIQDTLSRLNTETVALANTRYELDSRASALTQALLETVGPNIPTKAFPVNGRVVLVEHNKPVRLLKLEGVR